VTSTSWGAGEIKAGSANALAGLRTIGTGGELDVAGNTTPLLLTNALTSEGAVHLGEALGPVGGAIGRLTPPALRQRLRPGAGGRHTQ
jgi:hypothetical protein